MAARAFSKGNFLIICKMFIVIFDSAFFFEKSFVRWHAHKGVFKRQFSQNMKMFMVISDSLILLILFFNPILIPIPTAGTAGLRLYTGIHGTQKKHIYYSLLHTQQTNLYNSLQDRPIATEDESVGVYDHTLDAFRSRRRLMHLSPTSIQRTQKKYSDSIYLYSRLCSTNTYTCIYIYI